MLWWSKGATTATWYRYRTITHSLAHHIMSIIQILPIIHFVPQIDLTSWFPIEELLWLSLDPLCHLVPLFGMWFLLLFALRFYLAISLLPLPFSKPTSSHRALPLAVLLNSSPYEQCLTNAEIQYNANYAIHFTAIN